MPGGESTTISKLLALTGLDKEIVARFKAGSLKIWGTCAGAILCANKVVTDNPVLNLGLADYTIARNAYGSQLESFETKLNFTDGIQVDAAFIRAPKILEFSEDFEVLAVHNKEAVFIKNGNLLVSTCHPELYENNGFYEWLRDWFSI
jgi:5'-phosphate synthase pdxT subunit